MREINPVDGTKNYYYDDTQRVLLQKNGSEVKQNWGTKKYDDIYQ